MELLNQLNRLNLKYPWKKQWLFSCCSTTSTTRKKPGNSLQAIHSPLYSFDVADNERNNMSMCICGGHLADDKKGRERGREEDSESCVVLSLTNLD